MSTWCVTAMMLLLSVSAGPVSAGNEAAGARPPLYENLGTLTHPISSSGPDVQAFFDQGLRLTYAFNHEEAIRSFGEAARRDPEAAMAYWGIALALGPNINAPMDREAERRAAAMVRKAKAATHVSETERQYIDALAVRYSEAADVDRKKLDAAYADAMRRLSRAHPDDLDAATLFAESLMDLRPWDFWKEDGTPQPGTEEILAVLEHVLSRAPDHMGACHFYIHAVEASTRPERALPCAQRLPQLAPGAGHLVHMPAHIYMRVGRYGDAVQRNEDAVAVDRRYLDTVGHEGHAAHGMYPLVYVPHNMHFLWAALTMQGREKEAIGAAKDLAAAVPEEAVRAEPMLESFAATAMLARVRFGRWHEIIDQPASDHRLPMNTALWHYARGMAFTALGRLAKAEEEARALDDAIAAMPGDRPWGNSQAKTVLQIAGRVLNGELAARRGRRDEAIGLLKEAVTAQDDLQYNEPPDWYYPVRQTLGFMLLYAGQAREAERVFREDLDRVAQDPWALYGLMHALREQKRRHEAKEVEEQFQRAWSHADESFKPSRFEPFLHDAAS